MIFWKSSFNSIQVHPGATAILLHAFHAGTALNGPLKSKKAATENIAWLVEEGLLSSDPAHALTKLGLSYCERYHDAKIEDMTRIRGATPWIEERAKPYKEANARLQQLEAVRAALDVAVTAQFLVAGDAAMGMTWTPVAAHPQNL